MKGTLFHKTLGIQKIEDICNRFYLMLENKMIVDEVLEHWENIMEQAEAKITVPMEKIRHNSQALQILQTLLVINLEFVKKKARQKAVP